MTDQVIGAHNDLHSEQGALKGEHAGRSANPIIKVQDVIWLEFEKPDLVNVPRRLPRRLVSPPRCAPTRSCTCGAAMPARRVC